MQANLHRVFAEVKTSVVSLVPIPSTLFPLCAYLLTRKGKTADIAFIDSLPIAVSHNRRIPSHKVFAHLAECNTANFCVNMIAALIAYTYKEKLPSLNICVKKPSDLLALV